MPGTGGAPAAPGANPGTGGAPGGIPLNFERRKTSKKRLELTWDFPASLEIEVPKPGQRTSATKKMYALPKDEAFKRIAGDDRRPMLVVRECGMCQGTDDAFLSRTLDNEKTMLLARWFHCVKLMHHVVKADHTFGKLFEGPRPPHLFLASPDGSNFVPLSGTQSQSELWSAMQGLLKVHYNRDAKKAMKQIMRVFSTYDHLDSMEDMLKEQIGAEIEKRGPKSNRLRRLKAKLDKIAKEKAAAMAKEAKISDLDLKQPVKKTAKLEKK